MGSERTQVRRAAAKGARRWRAFVLGFAALVIAGCGGESASTGSGQASAASGPRARLIAQADAICRRRDDALEAIPLANTSNRAVERYAAQSAARDATAISELVELSVPASMAREWPLILTYTRDLRNEMLKLNEDAKHGNTHSIPALSRQTQVLKGKLELAASRAGFTACAQL